MVIDVERRYLQIFSLHFLRSIHCFSPALFCTVGRLTLCIPRSYVSWLPAGNSQWEVLEGRRKGEERYLSLSLSSSGSFLEQGSVPSWFQLLFDRPFMVQVPLGGPSLFVPLVQPAIANGWTGFPTSITCVANNLN